MSAISTSPRPTASMPKDSSLELEPGVQRIVIRHIPWELYDRLSDAVGDG